MNRMTNDLSALISTRICHDLINPIGAISNGLELLGDVSRTSSPELELVAGSAEQASAKLSYFRLAFGSALPNAEASGPSVERLLTVMYTGARFRPNWTVMTTALPRGEVKLTLLLLLCVEASLKTGGTCSVSHAGGVWTLHADGPRVEPDPDLWSLVTEGRSAGDLSSKDVQFAVAAETAALIGRTVRMSAGAAGMTVQF